MIGCDAFEKDRIIEHQDDLLEILEIAQQNNLKSSLSNGDDILSNKMRWNRIDKFEVKYKSIYGEGFMEIDSVAIYIQKSSNIFDVEKRIIYDFAKTPRNLGSDQAEGAAYEIIQVSERWYFETFGFD